MGPEPYFWAAATGSMGLYLAPGEYLTWRMWATVPLAIGKFVIENGLRGSQFILLWQGFGPVGFGQISTNAALATTSFPDPYDRHYDDSGLTIEFYGYRDKMPPMAVAVCVNAAVADALASVARMETEMVAEAGEFSYVVGTVSLFLRPMEGLTWARWALIPIWIQDFVSENGYRSAQFVILLEGVGPVGSGQIIGESRDMI